MQRRLFCSTNMKIYRRLVPKMAKDIVRVLVADKMVELEEGRREEAELDIAGVLVDHLNAEEQLASDAKDHMIRHGFSQEKYGAVRRALAEQRHIKIGDEAFDFLLDKAVKALYQSKNVAEVFSEDHDLRKRIRDAMSKYAGVDEELDREVRSRLKNLREGTGEWDIEYQKAIRQLKHVKGIG